MIANLIYNIFSIVLTFSLIFLFLTLRLNREIFEITLTKVIAAQFYLYFLLFFISSFGLLICVIIVSRMPVKNTNFWNKCKNIIKKYNIFFRAYELIFNYLGPDYTIHLINFAGTFVHYSRTKINVIICFFVFLPRFVINVILVYEVFVLQNLHYYFYSLILLFIPILFKFFTFIFNDLKPRLFPEFSKMLDQEWLDPAKFEGFPGTQFLGFSLKPEYAHLDLEDLLHNFYNPLLFLPGHMDVRFMPRYKKINVYSIFFYYVVQTVVWGYLLIILF